MANIDTETLGLSELTRREDTGAAGSEEDNLDATSSTAVPQHAPETAIDTDENVALGPSVVPPPSGATTRPTIVTAIASGSSSSIGLSAPHQKKFSAVNINKTFLQKNSSSPISSSPISSSSPSLKSGTPSHPIARPAVQLSASHSRLITTKLTATPQSSTTTGPGWSRPSSVNPSVSPSPPASNANGPSVVSTPAAPQLPHAGKVIQPQHRATAVSGGSLKKDGSGKPVWGNVRSGVSAPDTRVQNDFPTAAEVASVTTSVRKAKLMDAKEAAENAAADKQARSVEADTFRGVHLDPNAHHWDEMEEDDDNFLDGVIEFGDGRQYKIQPAEAPVQPTGPPGVNQHDVRSSPPSGEIPLVPVSKEERFADDDYDRSWPRSKTSPAIPQRESPPHPQHPIPPSPSSSQATHSPQDASRVLFNERSNKLEPYSSTHPPHRPGPGPGTHPLHRKASLAETGTPIADPRGRDLPPHAQVTNVQLLQKPGAPFGDAPTRPGPFGPIAAGSTTINKDKLRDRDTRRQVVIPSGQDPSRAKDHLGPASPLDSKDQGREGMGALRGRRLSSMGPPPTPTLARDRSKETGRQLPPHLSQMPVPPLPLQRRLPSKEPQPRPPSTVPSDSPSSRRPSFAHPPSQSPVLSHGSVTSETPSQTLSAHPVDLEQYHKTTMHLSAERAKQRRQQEEEERAKQSERARQKAAELEAKAKESAAKTSAKPADELKLSDTEVTKFLEDAVQRTSPLSTRPPLPPVKQHLQRPPSLRATPRQPGETARPAQSLRSPQSPATTLSPAVEAESWRSKTKANPSPPRHIHSRPSVPLALPKPLPPMLHGIEPLAVHPDEDLEIVDFSEMGKFVGVADPPPPSLQEGPTMGNQSSRPSRPVAADFFGENSSARDPLTSKSDTGPWRRKPSRDFDRDPLASGPTPKNQSEVVPPLINVEQPADTTSIRPHVLPEATLDPSSRDKTVSHDPQSVTGCGRTAGALPLINGQRVPRSMAVFREPAMSALDDAMSRIKGALDGMQQTGEISKELAHGVYGEVQVQSVTARLRVPPTPTTSKALPRESDWVSPALRPRNNEFDQQPREVFDITMPEPPRSPKPAWNAFIVRLPRTTRLLEPLTKRQYHLHKSPPGHVRWDILSFNPPVEGMNRRDFSLNDVLFRKPSHMAKGKRRYVVLLPKERPFSQEASGSTGATGPKVRVPPSAAAPTVNGVGAFGRPSGATDSSTWRKSAAPLTKTGTAITDSGLSTVSRSPPPDLVSSPGDTAPTKVDESTFVRSRSQPKMPAGSAVAFYRDSRLDSLESAQKSSVNFTVTSELEDGSQPKTKSGSSKLQPAASPSVKVTDALPNPGIHATSVVSELKSQPASPEFVPTLVQSKTGSKSSDDSTDRVPITPPSQSINVGWTKSPLNFPVKDSPARAPDPEHLKAVWSQASDKARVHSVNSLEGIADDLTGLPFTLQDVKSEDGETPPPTGSAAPSRMSLHDVTRAFQQVPSSSSSATPQRSTPLPPPSGSGPVVRPPNFQYSLPPSNPNMRPSFATYPSPMMSHSPSPTLVYPGSPVPGRMPVNGSPMFGWMSLPPPNQTHGMMRPMPYPGQMMSYPSPDGTSIYAHHPQPNMQNPVSQQTGARGRGMPPMSPAMQHAAPPRVPMYPGSPVLMHVPSMHGHSYMSPAGRGQVRNDAPGHGHSPMQPSGHHLTPHPGYTPVPPASFARPNW